MGAYINPGAVGFSAINTRNYVDKTMLIDLINSTVGSEQRLTCISRPRRFGKSYAARMLSAYYDVSCDSHFLFDDKKIAATENYERYINKYNVIHFDTASFVSTARMNKIPLTDIPLLIMDAITKDLENTGFDIKTGDSLSDNLIRIASAPEGKQFIFIIDEWDAVIREAKDDQDAQRAYLDLLRVWFKNEAFTSKVVAAAYMTGILPIKKDGSQSALSDFREYTMIKPRKYAQFIGFTENEVGDICKAHNVDFKAMKHWYNGYSFPVIGAVYNPNSVIEAASNNDFCSYWTQTSTSEALLEYISKSYNGLSKTIAELVGGIDVKVNTLRFANDLTSFRGKDDVLTLLIHLGYLAYDEEKETVRIPNEEIKREFQDAIHEVKLEESRKRLDESEKLFEDTISQNEKAVALQIEKIHMEEVTPLLYNREDSLRSVIKLAYYTYRDHYFQFEELPAGNGFADIVYIPLPDSNYPALVVELKWDETALGAIGQILRKNYPAALKNFKGEILLVGINYDREEKRHTCKIRQYTI